LIIERSKYALLAAPFFHVANMGVMADVLEFVPELTKNVFGAR
jgi:electron transfer flavoprotein alpha subunit